MGRREGPEEDRVQFDAALLVGEDEGEGEGEGEEDEEEDETVQREIRETSLEGRIDLAACLCFWPGALVGTAARARAECWCWSYRPLPASACARLGASPGRFLPELV